jgi:F0F1-type ATP synthase alpha subunit
VLASVTAPVSSQFTGPLSATTLCELYRNIGHHCSITYDDFSKHAVAYRQLSLLLKKPAGREAFPSDVFYLHARILERSCCLDHIAGLGTLMSLPIIETLNNDLSAYIATNVISITDGQLYLDTTLFGLGSCPAISTDKSVSRVGAKSLEQIFRALSFRIYGLMGDFKQEMEMSGATRSEGYRTRALRYGHILRSFIQRAGDDRWKSTLYLWAIISGQADRLSTTLLVLILYTCSNFSSP